MCFCRKKNLPWFTKLRTYENSNQLLQIIVNARKPVLVFGYPVSNKTKGVVHYEGNEFDLRSFLKKFNRQMEIFFKESESNDWLFTLYNADGLGRELPFEAEVARVQMDAFFDELLNEKSLLATCIRCFTNTTPRHHEYYDHEHQ
ncbi:DUF488 family protein [Caenorhabditis elegans]|uniref:DUF488 family protein n=1 Tax=Caenorhabditis elegans TaxID=6239 RepID=Q4W524_CAEEL|nr:DUF488 family protein [Caenorhabditis elegans]CCD64914.1 DUF488 family protein [Caenorhabditis elegans]|eukprot:NP_001021966.1 Uncharacterized protein CELE_C17F4.11 [Caenorhabditis elegans]